jgi:hypothetical protein
METFLTKGLKLPDMQKRLRTSSSVVRPECMKVAFSMGAAKLWSQKGFSLIASSLIGLF